MALGQHTLQGLREGLEQDRDALRSEIDQLDNGVRAENQYDEESSGYSNHPADTGTETYEQERNLALERAVQAQLTRTEHALAKVEAGTYGQCDDCGGEIAPDRLTSFPQAALCLSCQEKREASFHV